MRKDVGLIINAKESQTKGKTHTRTTLRVHWLCMGYSLAKTPSLLAEVNVRVSSMYVIHIDMQIISIIFICNFKVLLHMWNKSKGVSFDSLYSSVSPDRFVIMYVCKCQLVIRSNPPERHSVLSSISLPLLFRESPWHLTRLCTFIWRLK